MKIAPLVWNKIGVHEWAAETPASHRGNIWCMFDQGKYWPVWDCSLPGYDTKEEVMAEGQKYHNAHIKDFISKYTISSSE